MVELIWTDQAIKDVDNIAIFISKDSYHYAKCLYLKYLDQSKSYLFFQN